MSSHPNALLIGRMKFPGRGSKLLALDEVDKYKSNYGEIVSPIGNNGYYKSFRIFFEESDSSIDYGLSLKDNEIALVCLVTYGYAEVISLDCINKIAEWLKEFCSKFCTDTLIEISANFW